MFDLTPEGGKSIIELSDVINTYVGFILNNDLK